jgi:hypothetical protein
MAMIAISLNTVVLPAMQANDSPLCVTSLVEGFQRLPRWRIVSRSPLEEFFLPASPSGRSRLISLV